jgi:hypothetical protein
LILIHQNNLKTLKNINLKQNNNNNNNFLKNTETNKNLILISTRVQVGTTSEIRVLLLSCQAQPEYSELWPDKSMELCLVFLCKT